MDRDGEGQAMYLEALINQEIRHKEDKKKNTLRTTIFVTNNDDWEGIYVNGVLEVEDHVLSREAWVKYKSEATSWEEVDVEGDWLHLYGNLPCLYSEFLELEEV